MKQVVIAGAAGGIGSAIAHYFAANDCFVYAVDINRAACEKLAEIHHCQSSFGGHRGISHLRICV